MKKILLILMVLFAFIACDNGSSGSDGGKTPGGDNGFVGLWETKAGETLIFEPKDSNQPRRVTGTLLTAAFEEAPPFTILHRRVLLE